MEAKGLVCSTAPALSPRAGSSSAAVFGKAKGHIIVRCMKVSPDSYLLKGHGLQIISISVEPSVLWKCHIPEPVVEVEQKKGTLCVFRLMNTWYDSVSAAREIRQYYFLEGWWCCRHQIVQAELLWCSQQPPCRKRGWKCVSINLPCPRSKTTAHPLLVKGRVELAWMAAERLIAA